MTGLSDGNRKNVINVGQNGELDQVSACLCCDA